MALYCNTEDILMRTAGLRTIFVVLLGHVQLLGAVVFVC